MLFYLQHELYHLLSRLYHVLLCPWPLDGARFKLKLKKQLVSNFKVGKKKNHN